MTSTLASVAAARGSLTIVTPRSAAALAPVGADSTVGSYACTVAPAASRACTIATLGESRRSSVPALNVRPSTPTVTPRNPAPGGRPAAARTLATIRRRCSSLTSMTPFISVKS